MRRGGRLDYTRTHAVSTRWLLVLGSDAGSGEPVETALAALRALGKVEALTPSRRFQDDDGTGRWFTNRLVRLETGAGRDGLREALRAVEQRIGRSEQSDAVVIDIDLLACDADGAGWRLDQHAVEKAEHRRPHVVALLAEAGIALE